MIQTRKEIQEKMDKYKVDTIRDLETKVSTSILQNVNILLSNEIYWVIRPFVEVQRIISQDLTN